VATGQVADSREADLLLLFPPQTEAIFFPYLSLPYLTGHLRRHGRRVHQADLNIALLHDALRHPRLLAEAAQAQEQTGLGGWYRQAMAEVITAHIDEIRDHVLRKAPTDVLGPARCVRLANHAIALLVRDTFLVRMWQDLDQLDRDTRQAITRSPAGYGVPVARLHETVAGLLERHRPRVVGLSVPFFSQLAPALLIAAWVRRYRPDTRICLGGQQVILRHQDLARLPVVRDTLDALCWSSGEEPLQRWFDALDGTVSLASVPGMTWLPRSGATYQSTQAATLRFRDLGPPDFTGLPFRSYADETSELAIMSCVGCYWARCAFCAYGNRSLVPGSYQQGTVTQIADAVESVVRSTGAQFLGVVDENTNLRLIIRAMREVRTRGIRIRFSVRSRLEPSLADPAFCHRLAEAGCAILAAGYEGTSQRLLDRLDRGVRAADYQRIIDNLAAAGIVLRLSVMGYPLDETPEEFEASMRFLVDNERWIGIDALELMVAEPGSRLTQNPGEFGISLDTGGRLMGNPEFSYLAGRVGYPITVGGGPSREEALRRMARLFHSVTPGRVSTVKPPRPGHGALPRGVAALRPHPWVRIVPAEVDQTAGRIAIADLIWEQFYALPGRDIGHRPDGLLVARTERGQRLLAQLADAAAGVAEPAGRPS
jgi:anaerobic magnesium-protoporphyrin IX monomethyl ester cyclase